MRYIPRPSGGDETEFGIARAFIYGALDGCAPSATATRIGVQHIAGTQHYSSLLGLERPIGALHSKAMYARDAASIATPIGLVRVTGTADRIDSIAILASGEAVPSDAPAIRSYTLSMRRAARTIESP